VISSESADGLIAEFEFFFQVRHPSPGWHLSMQGCRHPTPVIASAPNTGNKRRHPTPVIASAPNTGNKRRHPTPVIASAPNTGNKRRHPTPVIASAPNTGNKRRYVLRRISTYLDVFRRISTYFVFRISYFVFCISYFVFRRISTYFWIDNA
jgi:hypothetical protein